MHKTHGIVHNHRYSAEILKVGNMWFLKRYDLFELMQERPNFYVWSGRAPDYDIGQLSNTEQGLRIGLRKQYKQMKDISLRQNRVIQNCCYTAEILRVQKL